MGNMVKGGAAKSSGHVSVRQAAWKHLGQVKSYALSTTTDGLDVAQCRPFLASEPGRYWGAFPCFSLHAL